MAKRKRLTPARTDYPDPATTGQEKGMSSVRAPISQVSGDAATIAALEELADEMRLARDSGRLIQSIPLEQIEEDYLVRDRVAVDDQEMRALMQSISERGQQNPVEVVQLQGDRFGLISGWRRLTALRRLLEETGDKARFSHVQAMLRKPDTAAAAYLSMVEENEIRVGLSYYERARIAAKAVEQSVYPDEKAALLALFGTASRAKRSKIRSFLPIYHRLDTVLKYAGAIPERLGLRLSKALEADQTYGPGLVKALQDNPATSPEAEIAVIEKTLETLGKPMTASGQGRQKTGKPPIQKTQISAEMTRQGTVVLQGEGIDVAFLERLRRWLKEVG